MAILELKNISYSYKVGKPVLKGVNHSFESGKIYGVVGQSDSGKTTLLSLLAGLTNPTSGCVEFNPKDLAKINKYKYRSQDVGVIFQSFNLLPNLTVAENIILSMDASGKSSHAARRRLLLNCSGVLTLICHAPTRRFCTCLEVNSSALQLLVRSVMIRR
jgi:putative ABC transport system ATP-binding protein